MLGLNQRKCSPMGSGGGRGRVRASIFFTSITSLPNPPPSPLLLPPYEHEYDSWIPLQECLSSYHGWTYLASFMNEVFLHSHWSLQTLFLSMAETWKKLHIVWTKHVLLTLLTDMSIANVPSTSCEPIKFKKLRKHVDYSLG